MAVLCLNLVSHCDSFLKTIVAVLFLNSLLSPLVSTMCIGSHARTVTYTGHMGSWHVPLNCLWCHAVGYRTI